MASRYFSKYSTSTSKTAISLIKSSAGLFQEFTTWQLSGSCVPLAPTELLSFPISWSMQDGKNFCTQHSNRSIYQNLWPPGHVK
nr:hypothetical protein Iba_chr06bCG3100 [Ipomoea batatas]